MKSTETRNYLTKEEESLLNSFSADKINNIGELGSEDAKLIKINIFESLLRGTNRDGIENIINILKNSDFYTAPSSSKFHCNYDGGLLDHSLLVCKTAMKLREDLMQEKSELVDKLPVDSIIITTLLHDVCKMGFYKKVEKWKKNESNNWVSYIGYETDDNFPIGHGEKSVIMLQKFGLDLNADEMIAIRFHMGSYSGAQFVWEEKVAYDKAINKIPLVGLVQSADYISSILFEKMIEN